MDTGEGRFVAVEGKDPVEQLRHEAELRKKYPKAKGLFYVGEKLEIKGSRFLVKDISPYGIKLKLLKGE